MRIWIRNAAVTIGLAAVGFTGLLAAEAALAIFGKKDPPYINPSRQSVRLGESGQELSYVVLGDSTGAGCGAAYADGIAMQTAAYLARNHRVTMTNLSISGAVAGDVISRQLTTSVLLKPDVVLLSVGANDATHFTSGAKLKRELTTIIGSLRHSSPAVIIIVTGCPQMGSIPRFAQPLRWFAGTQTARINSVFAEVVADTHVVWAPIAQRTGPQFIKDPTLFSSDEFHPNKRGYAVWVSVLDETIDRAVS